MSKFKIRASSLGKIMTNPRSKSEVLSQTAKSSIDEWIIQEFFNRKKEIQSKYLQKGNECEEQAIQAVAKYFDLGLIDGKNQTRKENDFLTGECDLDLSIGIVDVKCPWDVFTFPFLENTCTNKDYYYQGQAYMHLYKKEKFHLFYYLADCPYGLIESEARKESYKLGLTEMSEEIFDSFEKKMTYQDIPFENRVKVFSFDYDHSVIEEAKEKYKYCIEYIETMKAHNPALRGIKQ